MHNNDSTHRHCQKDERYYEAYLSHHTISRRGLLRGLLGGNTKQEKRLKNRPPFAAKEALLLQVCHGCADCIDACPYGLLRLVEGKPVLEIDFSACDFCGKCAEACTTGALHRAFSADTELRPIFSEKCLITQGQSCSECQQKCPQHALSIQHKQLVVSPDCHGCGQCKISCMLGAITLSRKV
ncbi:ferredoxin-type protein NapF [Pasteurella multocida]|uniref:ferredoxin-type protein NapF n=1 Tax=Pasteurella multocida TaxID=747 RepID=UPI0028DEC4D3|nr:ferredoxin-type protein NapF [Pasteurella multocida]HED4455221.1 ferredoxin-type protein NapF [Pasteurella multocida]